MAYKPAIDPIIIRENDIRGLYGMNLHERDGFRIGCALAHAAAAKGGHTLVIGRDGRISSPALTKALTRGIVRTGVDVIDIGIGPSSMVYFATNLYGKTGGAMVTASHNPPEYNGFKLILNGRTLAGTPLYDMIVRAPTNGKNVENGQVRFDDDLQKAYAKALLEAHAAFDSQKSDTTPLRVLFDAGHGATGPVLNRIVTSLPNDIHLINVAVDGRFPAHPPDPSRPEHLAVLKQETVAGGFDLALAFDGDGDRMAAIDHKGRFVDPDRLLAVIARFVLAETPGATVVIDSKASDLVIETVEAAGGRCVRARTGRSHIQEVMETEGAALGGEQSGHVFLSPPPFGPDDALYAALFLLVRLGQSHEKLADILDSLPTRAHTTEIRHPVDESVKRNLVEHVDANLIANPDSTRHIDRMDGIRAIYPDGWWLVRASDTEELITLRAEGINTDALTRIVANLTHMLRSCKIPIPAELSKYQRRHP